MNSDEALLDEITSTEILNYGAITTDELYWTVGRAVGSNSTTDLDGTLNVDGTSRFRDYVTMDDSLNVKMFADFDANVNIDGAVQIDLTLDVDGATDIDNTLDVLGATTLRNTLNTMGNADFDQDVNIDGNLQVDLNLNVDGVTTLDETTVDGTLDVTGNTDINGTLDVLGNSIFRDYVTMNDSLNVKMFADFDANVNIDGAAQIDLTLDVDGNTDLDGTLDVAGNSTFRDYVTMNDSLNVKMFADLDAGLNVDGTTTMDSLNAHGNADFDLNVNIDGNTQIDGTLDVDGAADFDATINVDGNATFNDFATFNDSVLVQKHLRINTDPSITNVTTMAEAELEVRNLAGSRIFQVDGHNSITTIQNLVIQQAFTANGNITAGGDFIGDDVRASGFVTTGTGVFGNHWPTHPTLDWDVVTRKDYVDYHREAQIGVPTAYSYDASLISGIVNPQYNDAVYYLNGNVVFYHDSTTTASGPAVPITSPNTGDNYTITVKGSNFTDLLTSIGGIDEVSAQLWLENNVLDLGAAHSFDVVDDETITFNIGYSDLDALTDCTSGVIRPTLALGRATDGFHMTGLHFFFDIVE